MARKRNYRGAQFNQSISIAEKAGAAIEDVRNLIMKYDDNGDVVPATAGTDIPIGVATIESGFNDITGQTSGKVEVGDQVDILIKDRVVVLAGGTIKKGKEVAAGADGLAVAAAGGDYVLGFALRNAEAGEYLEIQISKYQKAADPTVSGEQMTEEEGTL